MAGSGRRSRIVAGGLVVSLVVNVLLLGSSMREGVDAGLAWSLVEEFYQFESQAKSPADAESMATYVECYYPSGTKVRAGTDLDRIVESVRERVLKRLRAKTHKQLPGNGPAGG